MCFKLIFLELVIDFFFQIEAVSQKRYPGRGRDETTSSSSALKSFEMQKKEKVFGYDLGEQQVWSLPLALSWVS